MIYVHIPFCRSWCTYCGFYSVVAGKAAEERFADYAGAVAAEAAARRGEILDTLKVNTLYIGGGTPSVLPLSALATITSALPYGPYEEFTLEANPEDIIEKDRDYLKGLVALGVNRLSLGVQSFDDGLLRWMNRRHDSARALKAFSLAREEGFSNISVDLIFGISGLSDSIWEDTVKRAVELRPEHISAYQLSIEEDSALEDMCRKGLYREAPEEQCRRQYSALCDILREAGYHHYEVSNFALPGREAVHNSAYWKRVPYVGLGAAAHSFSGGRRSWNSPKVKGYTAEYEDITPREAREEEIMLGLRTDAGVRAELLEKEPHERLLSEGSLEPSDIQGFVRIPEKRFFVSDSIIRELV